MNTNTTTARVYVGTYAKYNSGSIAGAWLTCDDYADKDAFLEACAELHKDESDPELMFQDHEGIPDGYISESSIDESLWEFLELDDDEKEIVTLYRDNVRDDATIDEAKEAYLGTYDSEEDWAAQYWEESGLLADIPEHAQNYIDYEAYARDARLGGDVVFIRHNGDTWVFSNH